MMGTTFNPTFSNSNGLLQTRPLSSSIDVDRYYLKRSTCIASNMPIPTVNNKYGHAYVSIKEALQHFLSFEVNIDGMLMHDISSSYKNIISSLSLVTRSKMCEHQRSQIKLSSHSSSINPLIIYCIIWSDDFEPNHVKQFKKSTWIKTITFAPPQNCNTSTQHTYVLALSSKQRDHENVNLHYNKELQELKSPNFMYCKNTNCNIPVVLVPLAISADRPERSSLNCMLGHNGLNTKRWRYSAYITKLKLKSCIKCQRQRINCLLSDRTHNNINQTFCYDWNYNHIEMSRNTPYDYPKHQHSDSLSPPRGK